MCRCLIGYVCFSLDFRSLFYLFFFSALTTPLLSEPVHKLKLCLRRKKTATKIAKLGVRCQFHRKFKVTFWLQLLITESLIYNGTEKFSPGKCFRGNFKISTKYLRGQNKFPWKHFLSGKCTDSKFTIYPPFLYSPVFKREIFHYSRRKFLILEKNESNAQY